MRSETLSAPLIRKNMTRHWLMLFAVSIYFLTFVFEKIHGLALFKEMTIAIYGDIQLQKFQGSWQDEMFSGTLGILELLFSTLAALCAFSYLHIFVDTREMPNSYTWVKLCFWMDVIHIITR